MESLLRYFSSLTDPRVARTSEHHLDNILFIAIASIICGADGWNDMEEFDLTKEEWLKGFLGLVGGIPSHETFNHVFPPWILRNLRVVLWNELALWPVYAYMKS